ncbi:MAG: hypothetical protein MPN21_04875 [Thermoanaerobaculia bacterium]|nr:hypothetical protein [Thermoanaerobaculia bacterium]
MNRSVGQAIGIVVVAWLVLQTTFSLASQDPIGLEWVLDGSRRSPDLASLVVLPWVSILLAGALTRIWETHRDALLFFDSLGRCLLLYGVGAVPAGVLEQALDFHFVPSIGIYSAISVLLLAACFGGAKRPFRHLSFDQAPMRWADVLAVVLSIAAYVQFCFDSWLWDLDREHLDATQWWLLQAGLTGLYLLLAWSLLHGSLVPWLGRVVRRLEALRRPVRSPWMLLREHLLAAGFVLAALMLTGDWAESLWRRDAWIFPRGPGNQVFLGVDWYFVSLGESLRAAQVILFWTLAAVLGVVSAESWRDRRWRR